MHEMTQSLKGALKRGLAVVLFTLLLVGATGAALSVIAAGVSALSNVHAGRYATGTAYQNSGGEGTGAQTSNPQSTTTAVTTMGNAGASASGKGGQGSGQGTQASATEQGSQSQSNANSAVTSDAQTELPPGWQNPPVSTSQSTVDRLNQQLSNMHSPVMQHLDAGGVTLGDQVQNAFGQLLSGLLQTLFVEQPDAEGSVGNGLPAGGQ